jgi:hypothetical protein
LVGKIESAKVVLRGASRRWHFESPNVGVLVGLARLNQMQLHISLMAARVFFISAEFLLIRWTVDVAVSCFMSGGAF